MLDNISVIDLKLDGSVGLTQKANVEAAAVTRLAMT